MGTNITSDNQAKVYKCVTLSSVPEQYRKNFFKCDKDGSGVLEEYNMNGKDEVSLMAKDWKEVSQEAIYGRVENGQIINPDKPHRNNVYSSTIFDEKGNKIREVQMNLTNFEYVESGTHLDGKFSYNIGYNTFTRLHKRNIKAREKVVKAQNNNSNSLF